MNVLLIPILLLIQSGDVPETPQSDEETTERVRVADDIQRFGRIVFEGFDDSVEWEEHAEYLITAIDSVYERNGWDSEPDLYSLHMIREVTAIPPWNLSERMNAISGLVGERYGLDEEQKSQLLDTLYEQMETMFRRHGMELLPSALEMLQTRLAGKPLVPSPG